MRPDLGQAAELRRLGQRQVDLRRGRRVVDPRYRLAAAVNSRSGRYTITERDLDSYLIPKRPTTVTAELLHGTGRGIAYTKSPFAYLFQREND